MAVNRRAIAAAIVTRPALTETSCGYRGRSSDGLLELHRDHRLRRRYRQAPDGNVVPLSPAPPD